VNQTLTTQEAADLLDVSRPTLVKYLDEGRIPFTRPGTHRRILLADLVAFQQQMQQHRRELLDAMSAESQTSPGFGTGFVATR
jgi:excisionase family DNA binding protein